MSLPDEKVDSRYLVKLIEVAAALPRQLGLPLVERATWSPIAPVLSIAALRFAEKAGERAYPRLLELLDDTKRQPLRRVFRRDPRTGVIEGLGKIGNPGAVEVLYQILKNEFPDWRCCLFVHFDAAVSLYEAICQTINHLTGQRLDGDLAKIESWLIEYKRNKGAVSAPRAP